ncbi:hypothetical protein BH23GEM11_BH23GEM11_18400 [soil metagenome]
MTNPLERQSGPRPLRRSALLFAVVSVCMAVPLACTDSPSGPGANPVLPLSEVEFAAQMGIDTADFTPQASVWIRDDVVGDTASPAAAADRVVHLYYQGWTAAGARFDAVLEEDGDPVAFLPGVPGPILGLRQGVIGMRAGGQRTVLVPPASGFGSADLTGVPGNSWLVLELRVAEVEVPDGGEG